jgi:hypothetical protein
MSSWFRSSDGSLLAHAHANAKAQTKQLIYQRSQFGSLYKPEGATNQTICSKQSNNKKESVRIKGRNVRQKRKILVPA